jgi:hypothetical protein
VTTGGDTPAQVLAEEVLLGSAELEPDNPRNASRRLTATAGEHDRERGRKTDR